MHSSTQSFVLVRPPSALCFVWCTSHADAGWLHPPAHRHLRSRRITALRIPAGIVSAYPMSSGRLGPPSRAPSCRRRRNDASPPGPARRSTALPMTACSSAAQAASRALSRCRASSSTHSRTRSCQRVHVDVAGHDRGHRRVAGDGPGGVAVQPGPAVAAGLGRERPAGGPPLPDLRGPLVLQRRVGVEQQQVGQRDVHPRLHRLPGPLRQQPGRQQPLHRLGQRVVVPLLPGPVIVFPGLGAQRVQHLAHHRRALGGQVAVQDPGPAERGRQLDAAVLEVRGPGPGRAARTGPARTAARPSRPAPPAPARAAAASSRNSRRSSRWSSGSLSVHRQISRPTDSETCPAASAASTRGWVPARRAHAVCPTAAPAGDPGSGGSATPARCTPRRRQYPCPAVNPARNERPCRRQRSRQPARTPSGSGPGPQRPAE